MKEPKKIKLTFLITSFVLMMLSTLGNLIDVTSFEETNFTYLATFQFYIFTIIVSILLLIITKKNPNTFIILGLLTFIPSFTFMYLYMDSNARYNPQFTLYFYPYIFSFVFLLASLFINEKKEKNPALKNDYLKDANISKENMLFGTLLLGVKGVPINTEVLLINDINNNSLNLVYYYDYDNQIINIPKDTITNITYNENIRTSTNGSGFISNDMKASLVTAFIVGSNPTLVGAKGAIFDAVKEDADDYIDQSFKVYYDVSIETINSEESKKYVISTNNKPETFIKEIKK